MRPSDPPPILTPHATCLACGCLCDDITVAVAGGKILSAERACALGLPWFVGSHPGEGGPAATIAGRAVALEEAIEHAAEILAQARAPVVWGLTGSSVEAVGAALEVADRIGAVVDLAGSATRAGQRAAFVRVGAVSATLGETKDRAEVVLFWGNHPDSTHPRHAERYSVPPSGRFTLGKRSVIVVDVGPVAQVGTADLRIPLRTEAQGSALSVLLALARGVTLDPDRVERATGQPLGVWADLIGRFRAACSATIFFGPATTALGPTGWDAALTLVRTLNKDGRRCVGLTLGEPGNVAGAEAVACWQAGAPGHLDFASGAPQYLPLEASPAERLRLGQVDVLLAVGAGCRESLPAELHEQLNSILRVEIAPGACRTVDGTTATVAIDVGRLGIEAGGTVSRVDGVMLSLRPALNGARPTDRAILQAIAARLVAVG